MFAGIIKYFGRIVWLRIKFSLDKAFTEIAMREIIEFDCSYLTGHAPKARQRDVACFEMNEFGLNVIMSLYLMHDKSHNLSLSRQDRRDTVWFAHWSEWERAMTLSYWSQITRCDEEARPYPSYRDNRMRRWFRRWALLIGSRARMIPTTSSASRKSPWWCLDVHRFTPIPGLQEWPSTLQGIEKSGESSHTHTPGDPRNVPNGHSIYCPLISLHSSDSRTDERWDESDALSLAIRITPKMGSEARD